MNDADYIDWLRREHGMAPHIAEGYAAARAESKAAHAARLSAELRRCLRTLAISLLAAGAFLLVLHLFIN